MAITAGAAAAAATAITSAVGYLAPRAAAHAQLAVIHHTSNKASEQAAEVFGAHAGAVIGPMAGAVAGLSPKNMFVAKLVGQATEVGVGLAANGAATALNQKAAALKPKSEAAEDEEEFLLKNMFVAKLVGQAAEVGLGLAANGAATAPDQKAEATKPESEAAEDGEKFLLVVSSKPIKAKEETAKKENSADSSPSSMVQAAKGAALLGFAFLAPAAAAPIMPYLGVVDAAQKFVQAYQANKASQPGKSTDPETLAEAQELLKNLSPEELAAATRILVDVTHLAAKAATEKNSLWGALGDVAQAATIAGISNGVGAWVQLKEIDLAYDAAIYGAGKAAEVPTSWWIGEGYISSAMEQVGRFFGHIEAAKVALSEENLKIAANAGQLAEKGAGCLLGEGFNLVNKPSSQEATGYGATAWKVAKYAGLLAALVPAVYISPAAAGVAAGLQLAGYLPNLVMKNQKVESLKTAAQEMNELAFDKLLEKEFVIINPKEEKKPEPQIDQEKLDKAVSTLLKISPQQLAKLLNEAFEPEAPKETKEPVEEPAVPTASN